MFKRQQQQLKKKNVKKKKNASALIRHEHCLNNFQKKYNDINLSKLSLETGKLLNKNKSIVDINYTTKIIDLFSLEYLAKITFFRCHQEACV